MSNFAMKNPIKFKESIDKLCKWIYTLIINYIIFMRNIFLDAYLKILLFSKIVITYFLFYSNFFF